MSAPIGIKAAAPKRPRGAGKPKPVPAAQLSDLEIRIALALRNFKPDQKKGWVELLERIAIGHQQEMAAARPARTLRLITGGAA